MILKRIKENKWLCLYCIAISIFFLLPYISNELALEHDTLFHISRIEGLATSFKEGNFLPNIYPYKNDGFGYGSPMFYSDLFLVIPAILYYLGLGIAICYKITIFFASLFSAFTISAFTKKLTDYKYAPYLAAALYLFSNYRITDVYVRGALGEVISFIFIPLIFLGAYELLYEDTPKMKNLVIGFTGLVLTHNLTFAISVIAFGILLIISFRRLNKARLFALLKATVISLGLSAYFVFSMLEQSSSAEYYLHYYATNSDLASTAMVPWQYFINKISFGYAGNASFDAMVVNVGWFITFLPIIYLITSFKTKSNENNYLKKIAFIGYIFMFCCSIFIPWDLLHFMKILQFPWRLMIIPSCLLVVPASIALFNIFKNQKIVIVAFSVIFSINVIHLMKPCFNRPFVMYNDSLYTDLIDGTIVNKYWSATYVRTEVAGADYLPIGFLDYEHASHCITDLSDNDLDCNVSKSKGITSFTAPENTNIVIPLTYYKGYTIKANDGSVIIPSLHEGRLTINTSNNTSFIVYYKKTNIQNASNLITIISLIIVILIAVRKSIASSKISNNGK